MLGVPLTFGPAVVFWAGDSEVALVNSNRMVYSCRVAAGCKPANPWRLFLLQGPLIPGRSLLNVASPDGKWWALPIRTASTGCRDMSQIWERSTGRIEVIPGVGAMTQDREGDPLLCLLDHRVGDLSVRLLFNANLSF